MKSLQQILDKNKSLLPQLMQKTRYLQTLDKLLRTFMEHELAKHCRLAEIKDGKEMVIIAENAAWATRLRYAIPEILKNINTQPEFKTIKKIRYRIKTEVEGPLNTNPASTLINTFGAAAPRQKHKISPQNEELWQTTLKQLKEHKDKNKH
jgi:hypothetical protein